MNSMEITSKLASLANAYPADMVPLQLRDLPRIRFHLELVQEALGKRPPAEARLCDVGGGIGLFSLGCKAIGIGDVCLVDDFKDEVNRKTGSSLLDLHRGRGVEVVSRDVTAEGVEDVCRERHVVTCFDSMEHWHHGPRRVLKQMMAGLLPGSALIIGVPNCVSLRKRLTVPLGRGKWSALKDWYETDTFRGHVREPDVGDLRSIAADLGLASPRIIGRNWAGYCARNPLVRLATSLIDVPLRLRPSLCSSLYLMGTKVSQA